MSQPLPETNVCLSGLLWTFLRKMLSLLPSLSPVCYGSFTFEPPGILSLTVARLSCIFLSKAGIADKDPFPKMETVYYIHNFKGMIGGTLFRCYPGTMEGS
ncbi:hypothetical protein BT93_L3958 [Corymbia citriodora subsp. variegata]|uniref:Uncharacterized protein n=1 Tax=Corymbia citriodora subsp. variegata TaxID=360336 RepID=A0A8T0CZA5_CORYI|nr:hypothetical protein BT93_L3958 [Corymbia citriodora subsp. variegata]